MQKFKKKPVVIDAAQWNGATPADAEEFCKANGLPSWSIGSRKGVSGIVIPTLEGDVIAQRGDWIIRGLAGEYYPCKPEIFEASYDEVGNE